MNAESVPQLLCQMAAAMEENTFRRTLIPEVYGILTDLLQWKFYSLTTQILMDSCCGRRSFVIRSKKFMSWENFPISTILKRAKAFIKEQNNNNNDNNNNNNNSKF
jgi:hypothetical protein